MKIIQKIFPLLLVLALGCSGCKGTDPNVTPVTTNTTTTVQSVQQAATIVEISAQIGCYYAVGQDSNSRPYFLAAVLVINTAVASGNYNPTNLANVLRTISIKGANSEVVYLAVTGAIGLYKARWAEAVSNNLDQSVYVKPILVALASGIQQGLDARSTEKRLNLKRR